jgi:hypothetical protein
MKKNVIESCLRKVFIRQLILIFCVCVCVGVCVCARALDAYSYHEFPTDSVPRQRIK